MATNVNFNGQVFSIPAEGDDGWATALSNYFIAISTGSLQKSGGTFTLSSEVDFGGTYGLKAAYLKSKATNPAGAGYLRLGNLETIAWRNNGNSADLALTVGADDVLKFNSIALVTAGLGSIVNADIATNAAIEFTKLQNLPAGEILVGNPSNKATPVAVTGAIAINDAGGTIINADYITDSMINSLAAISFSKMAALTASRALVSSAGGVLEVSTVSSAELGYLTGVTSAIQTQIDSKAPSAGSVTLTGVETLSNKTLTAPVINSPTGLVKADVGLSNVDNTSNATERAAIATLTNKTIGDALTFAEIATPSTPAAGLKKLYPKADGKVYTLDSAGVETAVGSGSGGGINYITYNDGAVATGWATYADAAGSIPVDGTGGSANITWGVNATTPLRGTSNFQLVKDAANRQGQGVSYDFEIDLADSLNPKMLQISFDHFVYSGTYNSGTSTTNSDLIAYIYCVTDGVLIEPAGMKIQAGMPFKATFQTRYSNSATKQQYRLILHQSLTGTSAYTMQFDNFYVGPQVTASGYAGSDWTAYTLVIGGSTTAPTKATTTTDNVAYWRRVGDTMEIKYHYEHTNNAGTAAGTGNYLFPLPSGCSIDTAKISTAVGGFAMAGTAAAFGASGNLTGWMGVASATQLYMIVGDETTTPSVISSTFNPITNSVNDYSFSVNVPITGWSSNTVASSETDTRVVAATAYSAANVTGLNPNNSAVKVAFDSAETDTHGAWDTTNKRYNVKVPGLYRVGFNLMIVGTNVVNNQYQGFLYKNGAQVRSLNTETPGATTAFSLSGSTVLLLTVGDYLEPYLYGAGNNSANTLTMTGAAANSFFSVERLSGPAQITATDTIYSSATTAAGQAITASLTAFIAGTEVRDTTGWYNATTGEWTLPVAGSYSFKGYFQQAAVTSAAGSKVAVYLYVNGASYRKLNEESRGVANVALGCSFEGDYENGKAGDVIKIMIIADTVGTLTAVAAENWLIGQRTGN